MAGGKDGDEYIQKLIGLFAALFIFTTGRGHNKMSLNDHLRINFAKSVVSSSPSHVESTGLQVDTKEITTEVKGNPVFKRRGQTIEV